MPLSRKTPLKAKTVLKAKTPLKRYEPIRPVSSKKANARPEYRSIFTDDMKKCYVTGDTRNVDPHHIFGGPDKAFSEKYHFMLPLRRDWHEMADYSIHLDREFDLQMKFKCQEYWINELGRTKEEWLKECRHWYVSRRKVS